MSVVIALYSKTDAIVRPWVEAGHEAVLVDIQHPTHAVEGCTGGDGITRIGADMKSWVPSKRLAEQEIAFVAAFPPCDHLAVSGARWFKGKGLDALADSIKLFERAAFWCEWFEAPYFIENPVSTISSYWRKPDHSFHPWQYTGFFEQDNYVKKTCLWTGNGFRMPDPKPLDSLPEPDDRIHKASPGEGRADFRSATPLGFSRAVYEANK